MTQALTCIHNGPVCQLFAAENEIRVHDRRLAPNSDHPLLAKIETGTLEGFYSSGYERSGKFEQKQTFEQLRAILVWVRLQLQVDASWTSDVVSKQLFVEV